MNLRLWQFAGFVCAIVTAWTTQNASAFTNSVVRFRITAGGNLLGNIDVELFDNDKPETVRNFLSYVVAGAYDNCILHRCEPGFVRGIL